MATGARQLDGVAQQLYAPGVVEVRSWGPGRRQPQGPGGLDQEAALVVLDHPGDVAGLVSSMVELADDPASLANQCLG
jgi:hypothetical protein